MQIIFDGHHTVDEAVESMVSMMRLFHERYGISNFRQMHIDVTLLNQYGEDVELVDATTSEVLGVFEVHKTDEPQLMQSKPPIKPALKLVVDNTLKPEPDDDLPSKVDDEPNEL